MKAVKQALSLILLLVGIVFAATNTVPVTLSLWPFAFSMTAPLFVVFALGVLLGFAISAMFRAFRALPEWQNRRSLEKQLAAVIRERDSLAEDVKRHEEVKAAHRKGAYEQGDEAAGNDPAL